MCHDLLTPCRELPGHLRPRVPLFDQPAPAAIRVRGGEPGPAGARPLTPQTSSGSSAWTKCCPDTSGSPSAPTVVETTALPIASASKIFSRVPPPIRSGTTYTAASAMNGPHIVDRARDLDAGRGRGTRADLAVGRRPTMVSDASGHLAADAREHAVDEVQHRVFVGIPVHRAREDEPRRAARSALRGEVVGVDAGGDRATRARGAPAASSVAIDLRHGHGQVGAVQARDSKRRIFRHSISSGRRRQAGIRPR